MDLLVPQPRPKESNREYACRVLRMNIMTFRLKPGEPLSEIEIAKLFQMSRTPVHEAITTLHNDWLIEIFPSGAPRSAASTQRWSRRATPPVCCWKVHY